MGTLMSSRKEPLSHIKKESVTDEITSTQSSMWPMHTMCAEAIGANGKQFAWITVVEWARMGHWSDPIVCTQGLLWDSSRRHLSPCPHILVLGFDDPKILVHIWPLLRRHNCQSRRIKHVLFNSLTWFVTFKYWNTYDMSLEYYSCLGP